MATSQNQIDILLKAILDAKGFEELKVNLTEAANKTKETSSGAEKFGESLKEMGMELVATAGLAFSAAEAFAFLKDSFHAAVEEEAGAFRLRAGLQAVAGASTEATAGAAEFIEKLERQAAISDDDLRPALVQLAGATHDVTQAQNLLKMAADAANSGVGDFNSNVQTLTRYLETGTVRGVDPFANALRGADKAGGDINKTLNESAKRFSDLAEKNQTVEFQLRQNKIAWDNTKEAIGGMVSTVGNMARPALEFLAYAITMVVGGLKLFVVGTIAANDGIVTVGASAIKAASGDFYGAAKLLTDYADRTKKAWSDTSEEVTASLEKINLAFSGAGTAAAGKIKVTPGKKEGAGDEDKAYDKWLKDQPERLREMHAKMLQENAAFDAKWNEQARAARLKEQADTADEEKRKGASLLKIKKLRAKTKADELRVERDYWKNLLASTKSGTAEYLEIYASYTAAQKALDQETVKSKEWEAKMKWDTARQGVAAASAAFGGNKEIAMAGVAMDTFSAAQSAYKAMAGIYPAPLWGVLAAAIAIADGAQNMKGIEKANPGKGGFDIPEHDMTAYIGGKRWADDMVRNFTQGVSSGWKDGMNKGGGITNNQSVTNNNQRTTNVHITGLGVRGGDDANMRKDARRLQTYLNQLESERTTK